MPYNPEIHHRRSIRLKGYDYSKAGAYFVTICSFERQCLFGEIIDGEMKLNSYGQILAAEWIRAGELRTEIKTGECVVMPNHFHGIMMITDNPPDAAGAIHELPLPMNQQRRKMALPMIIGRLKMITAKRVNINRDTPGIPVWQRNYYEHVIRNDADYLRIAEYVASNPLRWTDDILHPDNFKDATPSVTENPF